MLTLPPFDPVHPLQSTKHTALCMSGATNQVKPSLLEQILSSQADVFERLLRPFLDVVVGVALMCLREPAVNAHTV